MGSYKVTVFIFLSRKSLSSVFYYKKPVFSDLGYSFFLSAVQATLKLYVRTCACYVTTAFSKSVLPYHYYRYLLASGCEGEISKTGLLSDSTGVETKLLTDNILKEV